MNKQWRLKIVLQKTTMIHITILSEDQIVDSRKSLLVGYSIRGDKNSGGFILECDPVCVQSGTLSDITTRLVDMQCANDDKVY